MIHSGGSLSRCNGHSGPMSFVTMFSFDDSLIVLLCEFFMGLESD